MLKSSFRGKAVHLAALVIGLGASHTMYMATSDLGFNMGKSLYGVLVIRLGAPCTMYMAISDLGFNMKSVYGVLVLELCTSCTMYMATSDLRFNTEKSAYVYGVHPSIREEQ
jgi:hypothetical protein